MSSTSGQTSRWTRRNPATVTDRTAVRILGIDPGSIVTGFGVIDYERGTSRLVSAGAIKCTSGSPLADRLARIFDGLDEVVEAHRPHEVAVESLFHAKSAHSALILGHARGVALLAVARRHLQVHEYSPREVKKALVGYGDADKKQVEGMVRLLLGLKVPIRPVDASDGLAIAICHAHSRRLGAHAAQTR